ncbi:MAG: glycoside hydrolase family 32 protein [Salegentibacter sp.]
MKTGIYTICLCLFLFSCKEKKEEGQKQSAHPADSVSYNEQYRPQYHFSPREKWMNDPNGLVYFHDTWHMFFQHYPDSTVWGPMHWGHAVSKDLVHWQQKPIALYPDSLGYIFSGSAVIDKRNTAGFGENAMVAIFTYHNAEKEKAGDKDYQSQGIAYSTDEGKTWEKYSGNPVLPNPGKRDFRDPKVFWDPKTDSWKMILAAGDHLELYSSSNLKKWEKVSEFTDPVDEKLGVWECPDLFPLKAEGDNVQKWVLIISHNPGAPNGGSGTRYFIGDYDGKDFTTNQTENLWLDYGTDNYAGVTFNNAPDDERILIGWMNNWNYGQQIPTKGWRSAMTLPRRLKLHKDENGYFLTSFPVENVSAITRQEFTKSKITGDTSFQKKFDLSQAKLSFELQNVHSDFQIVFSNASGEKFVMGYRAQNSLLYTDRINSGKTDFSEKFAPDMQKMKLPDLDKMKFDIFLDRSSVEIFLNDGRYSMTNQVFPSEPYSEVKIKASPAAIISQLSLSRMQRIW